VPALELDFAVPVAASTTEIVPSRSLPDGELIKTSDGAAVETHKIDGLWPRDVL